MEYKTIAYTDDHKTSVAAFFTHLSEKGARENETYQEWKYDQNPWIDRRLMVLCFYGNQLVGMRGAYGTKWQNRAGEHFVLPHADDLLIHPDHRSKGLFIPIMKALEKEAIRAGYHTIISLSGGEDTQNLQMGTGWTEMQRLRHLSNYDSFQRYKSRFQSRSNFLFRYSIRLSGFLKWNRLIRSNRDFFVRIAIRHLAASNNNLRIERKVDIAQLNELRHRDGSAHIWPVRDDSFYKWRLGHPHRRSRIMYWRDRRTRGYMVLTWARNSARCVNIEEFGTESDKVFESMIRLLASTLPTTVRILENSLTANQREIVRKSGFGYGILNHPEGKKKRFLLKHLEGSDEQTRVALLHLMDCPIHAAEKMLG